LRIKKLELVGFKSFKDRTVIHFDEGITGIVGPNGCGKSNIVDALVWVMGEMSAKHLRGSSMEDVIFSGAEGYAPVGLAEVSLTLENDGGPFPAKYMRFSELMITRRLHRNGESEYLINKEPSRLRDIQEIFMDTGAGSKGFSIIEQGAIGKIITSKPDDRRTLIEEAAGITKFKVRKRESQRKLESTDQNIVRLQDILGEQKRQLDSLERQAQRAERYRKIKEELQQKDLWLSARKYLSLHAETLSAQTDLDTARAGEVNEGAELSALELKVSENNLRLAEMEAELEALQRTQQEATQAVQNAELKIKELQLEIDQAKRSNEMTGSMLSQYKVRERALVQEKEDAEEKLVESRERLITLEATYQSAAYEFQGLQEKITNSESELTAQRREMLLVATGVSHVEARLQAEMQKLSDKENDYLQKQNHIATTEQKKDEFTNIRNRFYEKLENERQMQLDLVRDADVIQANLAQIRSDVGQRRNELGAFKDELNEVASRLYGLENLQNNFEGFEEGVKNVIYWQRSRGDSAPQFRPIAEVVEVHPQYELAMEAAMGNRLQTLISPNQGESLGALNYLKTQKSGRSSFMSTDLQLVEETDWAAREVLQEPGVLTTLEDVVSSPENIKEQVKKLFNRVVVVDGIQTALNLRARYSGFQFVTMDGDLLTADGILTGGAGESADSGVLRRKREIKELSMKREELSGKVQLATLNLKKLEEKEAQIAMDLEAAKKTAAEKEIFVAELKKDLERAEMELQSATDALSREKNELKRLLEQIEIVRAQVESLTQERERLHMRKCELETSVESLNQELNSARSGLQEKSDRVTELKVQTAREKQNVEGLERQVILVSATLDDLLAQMAQMGEESKKHQVTLTESQVLIETMRSDLTHSIHVANESELKLKQARNQYELYESQARAEEAKLSELRSIIHKHITTLNEAQLKLEQLRMKEEFLIVQTEERYQLKLNEVAESYRNIPGEEEVISKEVEELRDKVKKIGEVNLSAIEEYDGLKERYAFLSQQYNDLMEAKEHLRKVIDRINRICSRKFKESFEQVNERFQKVFPVLFGGGEAALVLVEDPEKDEPGIDIVARPPGKKLQNVTLLSGGEKALTAVSLIFAIFLVKPSPFCLLDEVDAPLDDANVTRFNDLVREMAKRSQIIVVTHNKHTMKVNNKLFGVTMQEKGVSKMVSVSLADAEKLAEANG
jgi:chromosome segregation protein